MKWRHQWERQDLWATSGISRVTVKRFSKVVKVQDFISFLVMCMKQEIFGKMFIIQFK